MATPVKTYFSFLDSMLDVTEKVIVHIDEKLALTGEASRLAQESFCGSIKAGVPLLEVLYPEQLPANTAMRMKAATFMLLMFRYANSEESIQTLMKAAPTSFQMNLPTDPKGSKIRAIGAKWYPVVSQSFRVESLILTLETEKESKGDKTSSYLYSRINDSLGTVENLLHSAQGAPGLAAFLREMVPLAEAIQTNIKKFATLDVKENLRIIATIKGGARIYGLGHIFELSASLENTLYELNVETPPTKPILNAIHNDISLMVSGLRVLFRLFAYDIIPDKSSPWLSWIENYKQSTRNIGKSLKKEVNFNIKTDYILAGKDLSVVNQILPHLLQNAIEHGVEDSDLRRKLGKSKAANIEFEVNVHPDKESHWLFSFSDDGSGIQKEKILRLARTKKITLDEHNENANFTKILCTPGFTTVDDTTQQPSLGLGLDMVRQVIQRANGDIKIATTDESGTIWQFEFPMFEKEIIRVASQERDDEILTIESNDDDALEYLLAEETLRPIICVHSIEEALNTFEEQQIGTAFIHLPTLTNEGVLFLEDHIKSRSSIPLVAVLGEGLEPADFLSKHKEQSIVSFLRAPLTSSRLKVSLNNSLDKRRVLLKEEALVKKVATKAA